VGRCRAFGFLVVTIVVAIAVNLLLAGDSEGTWLSTVTVVGCNYLATATSLSLTLVAAAPATAAPATAANAVSSVVSSIVSTPASYSRAFNACTINSSSTDSLISVIFAVQINQVDKRR
jgi:hypothetical protein